MTGSGSASTLAEDLDQLVHGGVAQLGIGGMGHLAGGLERLRAERLWRPERRRLSVGSPLIRKRLPLGDSIGGLGAGGVALFSADEQQADRKPCARRASAAATWAAMMPLASETPRPYMNSASSLKGM